MKPILTDITVKCGTPTKTCLEERNAYINECSREMKII